MAGRKPTKNDNQMVVKQKAALGDVNEMRTQTEMLIQQQKEREKLLNDQVDLIESIILDEPDKYHLLDFERKEIKSLIRRFGFPLVIESSEIAETQYSGAGKRLQKLGGICYNIMKRRAAIG